MSSSEFVSLSADWITNSPNCNISVTDWCGIHTYTRGAQKMSLRHCKHHDSFPQHLRWVKVRTLKKTQLFLHFFKHSLAEYLCYCALSCCLTPRPTFSGGLVHKYKYPH